MQEKIHVFARSSQGNLEPIQFIHKSQRYLVRRVVQSRQETYRHRVFYFFTVQTVPEGLYELHFELKTGEWSLLEGGAYSSNGSNGLHD